MEVYGNHQLVIDAEKTPIWASDHDNKLPETYKQGDPTSWELRLTFTYVKMVDAKFKPVGTSILLPEALLRRFDFTIPVSYDPSVQGDSTVNGYSIADWQLVNKLFELMKHFGISTPLSVGHIIRTAMKVFDDATYVNNNPIPLPKSGANTNCPDNCPPAGCCAQKACQVQGQ